MNETNQHTNDEVEEEREDQFIDQYDISTSPNDFNCATIVSYIERGVIEIPDFQRNYVWEKSRASKLIESLILGLPVPQIFLYEESKNKFLILDGQQRLMTIFFFVKGRIPKAQSRGQLRKKLIADWKLSDSVLADDDLFQDFSLSLPKQHLDDRAIGNKLEGLKYQTLGEEKDVFDLRTIRTVVIKQNEPKDDNSSIYEIYDRLNTSGVNLKEQEIRANLYRSTFYDELYKLNKLPKWRTLFGKDQEHTHMKDIEGILRCFAFLVMRESYKPTLVNFLNKFSSLAKKYDLEEVSFLSKLFEKFLDSIEDLSSDTFHRNNRFSAVLLEAVFIAVCDEAFKEKELSLVKTITKEKISNLNSNTKFNSALQEGTSKPKHVKDRIEIAMEILG